MKKLLCIAFCLVICVGAFVSCGSGKMKNDGINIVTTIFPEYDWVMSILGEKSEEANVTMLLDSGVDLHSYQPSADDLIKISTCDVFIYVGGESDGWVDDALKEAVNKDMIVVNLLDVLGSNVKEEEVVEGMQAEEEGEEEGPEYDEHVWLSLKNAATLVNEIKNAIAKADPTNADVYSANATNYIASINDLDGRYQDMVDSAKIKTLLFGDRFPFRYMADDYGLTYYAAFVGCSAESEASFETIKFLSDKVDELSLGNVITLEGTDHKLAETIISTATSNDVSILTLNSMQSTTKDDVDNGANYLTIMEENLAVLTTALN